MIRLGKNVTQAGDQLLDVTIEKLHKAIMNSDGKVASLQRRLQAVHAIDPRQYRKMKTSLPYVVCADFHPKARRKENFLHTDRFILDLDHLSEADLDLEKLRNLLKADPRVELMYTSPSGDGLKLFFLTDRAINDAAYYAAFYKSFAIKFQAQYNLQQVLDGKTHDVSRCCFVSFDPEAYYNPNPEPIITENYLRKEDFFALDELHKNLKKVKAEEKSDPNKIKDIPQEILTDEALLKIKEKMGVKIRAKRTKDYVQPEALEGIIDEMDAALKEVDLNLVHTEPISYGRKCRISPADLNRWAEVNVFLGKRGLSFVATTKTGSDKELAKQIVDYLDSTINPLFQ